MILRIDRRAMHGLVSSSLGSYPGKTWGLMSDQIATELIALVQTDEQGAIHPMEHSCDP
jgi:hypothetical protein